MTTTIRCWHFAADKLRDGKPLPKAGETLVHDGPVVPCESGFHGSVRALDALQYAPGAWVAIRDLSGTVRSHGEPVDKYAASEASHPYGYVDATNILHRYACWCATQALDREESAGRKVDPRSREAIRVKLAWLDGEATDAELAAAWAAAAAARAAAEAAAWAEAWAAAEAAREEAREAAREARAEACEAARAAQNTELERLLTELLEVK